MKEKLQELLQAIIGGKAKNADKALHEYLTAKTRSILSEADIVILDDDDDDDEVEDMGDEADVDVDDVEGDIDDVEGDFEDEGDVDVDVRDVEGDMGDEDVGDEVAVDDVEGDFEDEDSDEFEERLARKGRRTDKASKRRLR